MDNRGYPVCGKCYNKYSKELQGASATHQHGGNVRIIAGWIKSLHMVAEPEREKRIKALTGELRPIANRTARVDTDAHGGQLMPCVSIDNHV